MDQFLAIYNEVTAEFYNDLKRRLEITLHSVSDPFDHDELHSAEMPNRSLIIPLIELL